MRFSKLGLLTICSSVSAFAPNGLTSTVRKSYYKLNLSDRGWDNDNYLDALSGGQQSIEDANAKYLEESQARAAFREKQFRSMVRDVKYEEVFGDEEVGAPYFNNESPIPVPSEDNVSGGNRLHQMMEQAKQNQGQMGAQFTQPPQYEQPVENSNYQFSPQPTASQAQVSMQQGQQQFMNPEAYYQALQAWQQAMVAFQQFSAANPQAAAQMTPPPPPPPPPTFAQIQSQPTQHQYQAPPPPPPTPPQQQQQYQEPSLIQPAVEEEPKSVYDYLPKRVGGNKDAYEVNNSADVYFAQLKRDSTIRTEARKRGDLVTANSPFTEKGVIALGGLLSDELISKRRERLMENGGEFETSRDEMLLPQHFQEAEEVDRTYPGNKYKDKLMEAKKRRAENN